MLVIALSLARAAFLVSSVIQSRVRMSSPMAFSSASTSCVICALASAPKVELDVLLAEQVAELAVHGGDAARGARALLLRPGQVAAPEIEGLVLEALGQRGGGLAQQVVAEIGAPGVDGLRRRDRRRSA